MSTRGLYMPFIILDRDGVINHDSDEYIKSPQEWHPIAGSLEAIAQLNHAGYHVIVVTNQSGIARGLYDLETLHNIHQKLTKELARAGGKITEIYFCPHHPHDECLCRKPKPGLFKLIEKKYHLNLIDTYFVGDSVSDIKAAEAAGCKPLLVLTGNGKKTLSQYPNINYFEDLAALVDFILVGIPCKN